MIPIDTLRQLLRCDPATGKLFWLPRPPELFEATQGRTNAHKAHNWNVVWAGREALAHINEQGYKVGSIFRRRQKAHRVIWALVHSEWPAEHIDHINGVRSDNRIENLRVVTNAENTRNRRLPVTNTSGAIGVHWHKRKKSWQAVICGDGSRRHLGGFENFEEAVAARKDAEARFGFHANHGTKPENPPST